MIVAARIPAGQYGKYMRKFEARKPVRVRRPDGRIVQGLICSWSCVAGTFTAYIEVAL